MEHPIIIKSARDGATLKFFDRAGDYYKVSLCGANFSGGLSVYDFNADQLTVFFRDLAVHWQGWKGKKEWHSLEGELSLSATSDSTGHTSLAVRLHSDPGTFGWILSAVLLIEAGQLEQIAREVGQFVAHQGAPGQ